MTKKYEGECGHWIMLGGVLLYAFWIAVVAIFDIGWGFWCPGVALPASNVATQRQYRTNSARWVPWQEYIGDVNPDRSAIRRAREGM